MELSYWLTLALAVPAGGLLIRLFIILHDCGHGSFFRSRKACDAVGGVWLFYVHHLSLRLWDESARRLIGFRQVGAVSGR